MSLMASKLGRIGAAFERMSDRERKLVMGGIAIMTLIGLVLVAVLVSRRVSALEEEVQGNEAALKDISAAAPRYLALREEEKSVAEQLDRAAKEPLQATVLAIAKEIKYQSKDADGVEAETRLADVIKFANASDILAELTTKAAKKVQKTKTKKKKGAKEVFLSTIDAVFQNVPDDAVLRFLSKLETHPEPMFGLTVEITRTGPTRDQMQATIKIGQFRYGQLEE
ncbi:MAG: hypothetical protein HY902_16740 [Deltaproteobacteria bacterium]|nr:hypothetical protein [Deltaproteobacteria bacterium]